MWKESYRLGVEAIDKQHMELFSMVNNLLNVMRRSGGDNKAELISAISFMKEYTLQHFSDEEDYQKSIGYPGLAEHRLIHQNFTRDVLQHERNMLISNFRSKEVKDFMGMLIAWLVYHVAGDDQQIVAGPKKPEPMAMYKSPIESYFYISTCDILNKLAGLNIKDIKIIKQAEGNTQSTISVHSDLTGDISGMVTYKYTKEIAFNLIRSMASYIPERIDELVCSAMSEISTLISVKAIALMSPYGFCCNTEIPVTQVHPAFLPSDESIVFDTGMGTLEMEVAVV